MDAAGQGGGHGCGLGVDKVPNASSCHVKPHTPPRMSSRSASMAASRQRAASSAPVGSTGEGWFLLEGAGDAGDTYVTSLVGTRRPIHMSLPVNRSAVAAMDVRSTSGASGMPRQWICKHGQHADQAKSHGAVNSKVWQCTAQPVALHAGSRCHCAGRPACSACSRPASSGGGTYRTRSNRPGLHSSRVS